VPKLLNNELNFPLRCNLNFDKVVLINSNVTLFILEM